MNIVIDSNILFSALIKNSITRRLILEYDDYFLFPLYIFEELEEHKDELRMKSRLSRSDFNNLLGLLLTKVHTIPNEALEKHRETAHKLVEDIDIDDAVFVACTLAFPESILWSDDKKLKQITKITVVNTKEIAKMLKQKT